MFRRSGHRRSSDGDFAIPPAQSSPAQSSPQHQSLEASPHQSTTEWNRTLVVPMGDSFHDSVKIIRKITKIVNNYWGGSSMTYTVTPAATKELWWNEFQRACRWDPFDEMEIKRIFKKKCEDHIRHTLNHAKTRGKKPACITDDNWNAIRAAWESEDSKRRSQQNKINQNFNSGEGSVFYAGGSINIEEHSRRLARETGKEPSFIETFARAFQKKDKTWSGERAKVVIEKYDELDLVQKCFTASDQAEGSEPSVGTDLNMWLEVSGGSREGRILGMDSLSRTQRVPRASSSSTPPAVRAQISSMTEHIFNLEGKILEKDIRISELERNQELMQRNQDLIMRYLNIESFVQFAPPDTGGDDGEDDDSSYPRLMKPNMVKRKRKKNSDAESIT